MTHNFITSILFASALTITIPVFASVDAQTYDKSQVTDTHIYGVFNGSQGDWLTLEPVKSTAPTDMCDECPPVYLKYRVSSKSGTVPDLILASKISGEYENYLDGVSINLLNAVWEKGGQPRDGIVVYMHPDGSTIAETQTYVLDGGKWVCRTPLDLDYMSLDETVAAYQDGEITPMSFHYNIDEEEGTVARIFPFHYNRDRNIVIVKASNAITDLIVPKFYSWNVVPDYFGNGKDGLLLVYADNENPERKVAYIYSAEWTGPDPEYINGRYLGTSFFQKCDIIVLDNRQGLNAMFRLNSPSSGFYGEPESAEDDHELLPAFSSGSYGSVRVGETEAPDKRSFRLVYSAGPLTYNDGAEACSYVLIDGLPEIKFPLTTPLFSLLNDDYSSTQQMDIRKLSEISGKSLNKDNYMDGEVAVSLDGKSKLYRVEDDIVVSIGNREYKVKAPVVDYISLLNREESAPEFPAFLKEWGFTGIEDTVSNKVIPNIAFPGITFDGTNDRYFFHVKSMQYLGKNIMLRLKSDEELNENEYLAIFSPDGTLLDALFLGQHSKTDYDFVSSSVEQWLNPQELILTTYNIGKEADGDRYGFVSEFRYGILDNRFVLLNVERHIPMKDKMRWNSMLIADNYDFLKRYPLSATPYPLWSQWLNHLDAEWGEDADIYSKALFKRNPDEFAAIVKLQPYGNLLEQMVRGGCEDFSMEAPLIQSALKRMTDPTARHDLQTQMLRLSSY